MALEKSRGRLPQPGELAVVVGAGRSGLAAAKLLHKAGARTRLLEANPDSPGAAQARELEARGIEVEVGPHYAEQFANAAFVVPSPGMPIASLAPYLPDNRAQVISEPELAWRFLADEPVLAVTGTSGKTTTASLAAAMLKAQGYTVFLGGNIGTPMSEYVLADRKADVLVAEVSSFQLQGCSTFCPRAAIMLNLSPNHLDYHKDMGEYAEAKFRIFRCQDEGDLAILGADLKDVAANYRVPGRKLWVKASDRFPDMRLLGDHNRLNAEAAWQAARFFGVSEANAARAVAQFNPLPHRLEVVANQNGIIWINDSKATTPDALRVALGAVSAPVLLLCGGKFKGGDLSTLDPLIRSKVRKVYLFGASREIFQKAWQSIVPISWHPTLAEAVIEARIEARPGDTVLLSPATSSFDLYKNYVERGEDFRSLVAQAHALKK